MSPNAAPSRRARPLARTGLLLAPGAGADRNQSALVAIDETATAAGAVVSRMDFPYRKAGRAAPDREPVLLAAVREEVDALHRRARLPVSRIAVGGRSMGGRICSMAVAEGLGALAAVLISYPLHPPGRPDRMRTAHLPSLDLPCLFVSGTRDAFGMPAELEVATAAIPGPVTHIWLDGKDHGLRGCDEQVSEAVTSWLASVVGS
jgi:predicted alpha/beta-hydrolase family hydrolase